MSFVETVCSHVSYTYRIDANKIEQLLNALVGLMKALFYKILRKLYPNVL